MVKSKFKLLFSPSLTFILSTILVLRSRWGTRTTKKITTSAEQNDFNIEIPGATTSSCSSNIQLRLSEKFLSLWVLVYNGNGTDLGLKLANALSGRPMLFPEICPIHIPLPTHTHHTLSQFPASASPFKLEWFVPCANSLSPGSGITKPPC